MNCNDTFFGVIIGVMVLELRSAFLRCDLLNCTKHAEGEFEAIKEKEEFISWKMQPVCVCSKHYNEDLVQCQKLGKGFCTAADPTVYPSC